MGKIGKSDTITFRVNEFDKFVIEQLARDYDMSLSDFIRSTCLARCKHRTMDELFEMYQESKV